MNPKIIRSMVGIFLVGLTLFMYQITLTRLFSTVLLYHYVFMVISLSMLGLTVGGVSAFRWIKSIVQTDNNLDPSDASLLLNKQVSILVKLSLSLLAAVLVLYKLPYSQPIVLLYLLVSSLPFIFGGYYLALVFKERVSNSSALYFADLTGSALGAILIITLLDNFSILQVGFILSLIPLLVIALHIRKYTRRIPGTIIILLVVSLLIIQGAFAGNWAKDFGAYKGRPKMLGSLADENPRIVYTFWNSLARTDVVESDSDPDKLILVDGGAASRMIPYDGNPESVEYLKSDLGYLPFAYKDTNSALLIGPGGGKDILLANLAGVDKITAVELNSGSVMAAEYFKEFNGNIYGLDNVETYIGDGRSFISKDSSSYDVIFLSLVMTQASETLGYALSENYIYTKEAFATYLDHLTPGGTLAYVLHGENDLYKAATTLLKIFEERGIPREDAIKHIALVSKSGNHGSSDHEHLMFPLLMVKNTPFQQSESKALLELARKTNASILTIPHYNDKNLLRVVPPKEMENTYLVTDDYPFFYHQGRIAPPYIIFMLILVLAVGRIITRNHLIEPDEDITRFRSYFTLIGLGFMLIEIPILQKLILLFGHPTLTFAAVIAMLLFSAGLGSLLSKSLTKKISLRSIGLLISGYTLVLFLYLPRFISYYQGSELAVKLFFSLILLLPLGILMGIPFPTGLKMLEDKGMSDYVPLMWGVNGWMSVVGSILSLVLAMTFGYNITLMAGAGLYLIFAFETGKASNIHKNLTKS